jgi:hypothetical protein
MSEPSSRRMGNASTWRNNDFLYATTGKLLNQVVQAGEAPWEWRHQARGGASL